MNEVKTRVPSDILFWPIVEAGMEEIFKIVEFPQNEAAKLKEAARELFDNALRHGYKKEMGEVEVSAQIFDNALSISVRDKGEPFDERLLHQKDGGFERIKALVDDFRYQNLGLEGKQFTITKYVPHRLRLDEKVSFYSDIGEDELERSKEELAKKVVVRTFKEGDEVWIPKLIYRNYGYTYFKETFYYPQKILELERSGKILSIVAEIDGKIVGHFAMVRVPKSNIAEIGIAVVDPDYKGLGIMKKMFHLLLQKAKEWRLSAVFGEAITFHPYSQRANARFGFCTTALMLGDIHQMVQLKDHKYPFRQKRGAVALEYKILRPFFKRIAIPRRYRKWVERTYAICGIDYAERAPQGWGIDKIAVEYNPHFNIGTIAIDEISPNFERAFKRAFERLIAKHPDMIYADINLEGVAKIDEAVEVLRDFGFFYCGVAFLRRFDQDYLRLQFEVSENIEEQEIRCYSDFCKALHRFILEDKASLDKET